ncbi:hypothetical protein GCM10007962_15990 [Yeosuana aromativorans]|uniref:Uncharacterized protein n=1 Tax=Yeosuana aromativorans TaxID=288019 RepID=A0A8J3FHU6_9FLAO|nr:hypothetical protein GCM10007962_15990 [Yeosuana aromativorans]
MSAPAAVNTHPSRLILPYLAKAAGKTNMPTPIIFPITSDVVVIKPIFCGFEFMQEVLKGDKF